MVAAGLADSLQLKKVPTERSRASKAQLGFILQRLQPVRRLEQGKLTVPHVWAGSLYLISDPWQGEMWKLWAPAATLGKRKERKQFYSKLILVISFLCFSFSVCFGFFYFYFSLKENESLDWNQCLKGNKNSLLLFLKNEATFYRIIWQHLSKDPKGCWVGFFRDCLLDFLVGGDGHQWCLLKQPLCRNLSLSSARWPLTLGPEPAAQNSQLCYVAQMWHWLFCFSLLFHE